MWKIILLSLFITGNAYAGTAWIEDGDTLIPVDTDKTTYVSGSKGMTCVYGNKGGNTYVVGPQGELTTIYE